MEVSRKDIKYWVGFSFIPGVGRVRFTQLENYFGNLEKAWKATSTELKHSGLDNGMFRVVKRRVFNKLQRQLLNYCQRLLPGKKALLTPLNYCAYSFV